MGSIGEPALPYTDVLLVGAGFASFTLFNKLRKLGYSVQIYEKGQASGGIWYWNCYPGARVDSDTPIYQLFDKELYEDFTFRERYAAWPELRRYFDHVQKKWNVDEHVRYNKHVDGAVFNERKHTWLVECADESIIECRWFIPCIGFASRHYSPPFAGLSNFKGEIYHTAQWPHHGVSMKGKRVAIIGTGASGIQVSQEIGDKVEHLTIFQRTPNLCLPMKQSKLDPEEEERKKKNGDYERAFNDTRSTFSGFRYDFYPRNTLDDTPEEREKFYSQLLYKEGGFRYWLSNYKDMLYDRKANDEAYNFWRKSVLARVKNPEKQRILAPEKPPHPFGTKRPSLEQRFYEVVDQDHVDIINVNEHPIEQVEANGLRTDKGLTEIDVLILATGFDLVSGSLGQLNIQGTSGDTIADHWNPRLRTAMGIAMADFPNMFFIYGPQAPTSFANGPSCTQFQAEYLADVLKQAKEEGITRMEAKQETEEDWSRRLHKEWDATLFPLAKSWYTGANIPGRKVEPMYWAGGLPEYMKTLHRSLENGYQGWHIEKGRKI